MEPQAATPTGAEASARADVSAITPETSVHDRLKAHLTPAASQPAKPAAEQVARPASNEPARPVQAAEPADEIADEVTGPEAEAGDEGEHQDDALTEAQLSTLSDLAEATGLELDKLMDLDIPTKIDGKEGRARLRELIKSYQLEGHLNQKLMTFADEKKAFETERQTYQQQQQHKFMQMDAGLKVAQKLLEGEFSGINWQQLQDESPLEFNQKYVAFQQRQAQLNHLASMIGQERQQGEHQAASQAQAYLEEQSRLLDSKVPEWADKAKREKDIAEMAPVIASAYGISDGELKGLRDHREILVIRDAWKWQQLQKAKPSVLNKVKTAPRLLKPGTMQSRAEQNNAALKGERAKLAQTGKVGDATALLKRHLFNK